MVLCPHVVFPPPRLVFVQSLRSLQRVLSTLFLAVILFLYVCLCDEGFVASIVCLRHSCCGDGERWEVERLMLRLFFPVTHVESSLAPTPYLPSSFFVLRPATFLCALRYPALHRPRDTGTSFCRSCAKDENDQSPTMHGVSA